MTSLTSIYSWKNRIYHINSRQLLLKTLNLGILLTALFYLNALSLENNPSISTIFRLCHIPYFTEHLLYQPVKFVVFHTFPYFLDTYLKNKELMRGLFKTFSSCCRISFLNKPRSALNSSFFVNIFVTEF